MSHKASQETKQAEQLVRFGSEDGFHIDVQPNAFGKVGFIITIWPGNHGIILSPPIRQHETAVTLAKNLYDVLLPEYIADKERQAEQYRET